MLVRYHMTRVVRTFSPEDRAAHALQVMRAERFRFAPVLEEGRLAGVVTERDLLRKLPGSLTEVELFAERALDVLLVAHAMTRDVLTIAPNAHVEDAAQVLFERRIHGLPVVDQSRLQGVITASDIFRTMLENDAAREGRRLTFLLSGQAAGLNVGATCAAARLDLRTLMRHRAPSGAELATLRVAGPPAAVDRLIQTVLEQGGMLVEAGQPTRRVG